MCVFQADFDSENNTSQGELLNTGDLIIKNILFNLIYFLIDHTKLE